MMPEDKTMMRASMIKLKEKLEIVGDFRGSSEVRDSSSVMGGSLYSSVLNERMKVSASKIFFENNIFIK